MKRVAATVALAITFVHAGARAACEGDGPAVALRGSNIDAELRDRIFDQLRVTLSDRKIRLCNADDGSDFAAVLDITPGAAEERAAITLSVRDAITKKIVARDVDLAGTPPDARPLLLAQSADELLRASWAELLLAGAPRPEKPVPVEVAAAVAPAPPQRAPVLETGVGVATEGFGGGHMQVGPDISIAAFPFRGVGARVRAGYRAGAPTDADTGVVETTALTLGLGPVVGLVPRAGRFGLDAVGEVLLIRASFAAEARGDAIARNDGATAVYVTLGLAGWMRIEGPLRASLAVTSGAPLSTVSVNESDRTIVALSGVLVAGQVVLSGAF